MIHAFKVKNDNFVLDVESGTVLTVDDTSYRVFCALEKGEQPEGIEENELKEIYEEIDNLKKENILFTEAKNEVPKNEYYLKALCLHIAHDCNLRCTYCFGDKGAFGHKRELMSFEVAKAALDMLIRESKTRKNLEVDFFGGEPMMNFDVVKRIVEYGREQEKLYNKNIRFTITTNAYHLPEEDMDFINREMKNVVISIDGRKEVHDEFRKTAGGNGSYDKTLENAKKLIAKRGDKEYYVRGTFTSKNLDFSKDVQAIYDEGFEQVSVEPVVTKGALELTEDMLPEIFAEYERLYDKIVEIKEKGGFINFFHFMIDLEGGPCLNKRIRGCGAANEYVAVSPNGEIYPCHQFAGKEEFLLGNVFDGISNEKVKKAFHDVNVIKKPECASCFAKYFCSGGCAAASYNINGDISKNYEIGCKIARKRMELAIAMALGTK